MISHRLPALALIATLAGAGLAMAQQPPAPPAGAAHRGWDPAEMQARMAAHHAQRLRALHAILAIRPDQEAAFAAFAAALQPSGQGMRPAGLEGVRPDRSAMANLTTPERLDRMGQRMQEAMARRQQAFERRAAATKALYSALSPEQRRAMDALPMLRGGGGWGKGPGGRHFDGRGPDGHGQG